MSDRAAGTSSVAQSGLFTLTDAGWLDPVALGGLVLPRLGVPLQVRRVEEPHLAPVHGTSHSYASSTGRFLPGIGRITAAAHPAFVAEGRR